ncbi:hypothetical protein OHO28_10560 [Streptomyces europaeiscabiei]|uniref:hypothetical protein n=1 Tax=Streptomyces europaeiscabiei TaxID=146819 RepID=UPI002E1819D9
MIAQFPAPLRGAVPARRADDEYEYESCGTDSDGTLAEVLRAGGRDRDALADRLTDLPRAPPPGTPGRGHRTAGVRRSRSERLEHRAGGVRRRRRPPQRTARHRNAPRRVGTAPRRVGTAPRRVGTAPAPHRAGTDLRILLALGGSS